jgi:hypothetical protein
VGCRTTSNPNETPNEVLEPVVATNNSDENSPDLADISATDAEDSLGSFSVRDQNNLYNNFETDFFDLGNMKHWERIHPYIGQLGKQVKELMDYGSEWEYIGSYWLGTHVYSNANNNVRYTVIDNDSDLQGDEICDSISLKVGFVFPDAVWPQTGYEDSLKYLEEYLGLRFYAGDDQIYDCILLGNKLDIYITSGSTGHFTIDADSRIEITPINDEQYAIYKKHFGFQ